MSKRESQIATNIPETTKKQLDDYTTHKGVKKSFAVNEAILYYLRASKEIPSDLFIPPRILMTEENGQKLIERIQAAQKNPMPNEDLKKLFKK